MLDGYPVNLLFLTVLMTSMTGMATAVRSRCTRSSKGSSHPYVHSQWLSRKTSTSADAACAPMIFARIRPCLFSRLMRRVFGIAVMALRKSSSHHAAVLASFTKII